MIYQDHAIKGWMSQACLEWLYQQAGKMRTIVEIGTYRGRSAHALASGCRGPINCVDPWPTTRKGQVWSVDKWAGNAKYQEDGEEIYQDAKKNLAEFDNLTLLRMTSLQASRQFQDASIDMVFIDGQHSYENVTQDISLWLPKAAKLLCGHDYSPSWPGVQQAVQERFPGRFQVIRGGSIWYVWL